MDAAGEALQPIFTAHLFPKLEAKLIELLRSLKPEDWERQTLAPKWKVKDVAAHLLDTQIRKLAAARHDYKSENSKKLSPARLVTLINSLNAEGVRKYDRLPPDELISKMETASRESAEYHQALDPFSRAMFPVSWAGEEESANWFDTAREFTERWHHQQQIRLAVQQARHHDAGILLSCSGLFYARAAIRLSKCCRQARIPRAIQYFRRMRRKLASVPRGRRVDLDRLTGRRKNFADHDPARHCLAHLHKGDCI